MKKKKFLLCLLCFCSLNLLRGQDFEIASYDFDKKYNKSDFLTLFKTSNSVVTYGLSITDQKSKKVLYNYSVNSGDVEIIRVNDSTFFLIGRFSFPYADIYATFEIGKHIFKINKNGLTIDLDRAHSNYPKLHVNALKDIQAKYHRMKQDKKFTNSDWEKITPLDSDSVLHLSYELVLGILNGSKECIPLFQNMRKDFSIINAGAGSEELMGCENVLKLYGYIKENK